MVKQRDLISIERDKHALHFTSNTHEWGTPQRLFDALDDIFHFAVDVCASKDNAKCRNYLTKEINGLHYPWVEFGGPAWMNPPYGREIAAWLRKAEFESDRGVTVVSLLPSRTDTKWFHRYCISRKPYFLRSRIPFVGLTKIGHNAPFPSMIVIFRGASERAREE